MKLAIVSLPVLLLSSSLVLAQTGGTTSSPPAGPSATSPTPTTPAPSDGATTGRGPGVNPSNPQDRSGRSNPQDLNRPGGSNPQDMKQVAPNVPNIVAPEKQ